MIVFTMTSFVLLIVILSVILLASIGNDMKTTIITFVLLVVASLIYGLVIPPLDEWSAKRYDEAIKNVKIAREKYKPDSACKNDMTNYCLVINNKKLEKAIADSLSTFSDYCKFNAK